MIGSFLRKRPDFFFHNPLKHRIQLYQTFCVRCLQSVKKSGTLWGEKDEYAAIHLQCCLGYSCTCFDLECGCLSEYSYRLCPTGILFQSHQAFCFQTVWQKGARRGHQFFPGAVYSACRHSRHRKSGRCGWGHRHRWTGCCVLDVAVWYSRHGHQIC